VVASGSAQVTLETLPALRQRPGPGATLPVNFLKHADEQTVAALGAVFGAIDHGRLTGTDFTNWGIVAAPYFLGRATLAAALQRYAAEGAWGISPHFIPHRSQHAVSGTISQAFKIHGPNFGTGGGPGGAVEALLAGAVLVEGNRLPGVWVVLTGWDPELIPDQSGRPTTTSVCRAVALALQAARPNWHGPRLRVEPSAHPVGHNGTTAGYAARDLPDLEALLKAFGSANALPTTVVWRLDGGGWLELSHAGVNGSVSAPAARTRAAGRGWAEVGHGGAGTENQR
jgi:hypothetical protein